MASQILPEAQGVSSEIVRFPGPVKRGVEPGRAQSAQIIAFPVKYSAEAMRRADRDGLLDFRYRHCEPGEWEAHRAAVAEHGYPKAYFEAMEIVEKRYAMHGSSRPL